VISETLASGIRDSLDRREQVIVFFNRRGFADVLLCSDCGHPVKCPNCNISLTYHRQPGPARLVCHYCDHTVEAGRTCGDCGSGNLVPLGTGTQKIEVSLQKLFPSAKVERYDTDSTRKKGRTGEIYRDFLKGRIDILVGTQMVSKGLHFPNVTLVGVIGFEAMVNMPDFRSFENTVGLLLQVSGRTGRGDAAGEVLIQARDTDHPVIRFLKDHEYDTFFESEIKVRELSGYPPFKRLIRLLVKGRDEKAVAKAAGALAEVIRENGSLFSSVLGPVPAPFARLNRYFRHHIICKISKTEARISDFMLQLQASKSLGKCKLEIDVDPVNLL
jgi:primosomal protein N' (replication factor Y)